MPEDAGSIYSSIFIKLDEFERGIVQVRTKLDSMVKENQKKSSGFASFWKNAFQTAFGFGILQILNKLTSAMRNSLAIFSGFQQSMKNVQSVTKATGEDFRVMTEAAKEAGETTRFTARQAADALYYLGSAGFSAQQSVAALNGVLQLAGATQSDLAFTSETVASVISQYNLQAEDAGRISNVFAAAIANSQATMEKLATSFRQVGPVAAGFGMSLEQTTGALQILYNAGYQGSQAGRALKSALADLASPTTNMKNIFSKLGIELNKVNPATNELSDIIDVLAQSGATTADIIDAFGKIAGPQLAVLIRQGGEALRQYTDDITDTEAAAEAYKIQNDSLAGSMDFLRSKLESTAIAVFEKLEPGMRDLIDSFINFLDTTRPIGELLGNILNVFLKLASFSTGAITKVFDLLLGSIGKLKTPMQEVTDNLKGVRDSIDEAGKIERTIDRLSRLTDEYERLSSQTDLTESEQNRLKKVIAEIEKIAPDATTKMDEYGNAIEISGEKSREAARQMLESRKAIIEQAQASLKASKPALESLLKVQAENLKYLKEEEKRTAEVNRTTEGRYSILNEMKNVFQRLLEEEVTYGKISSGTFSRGQEGILRYKKRLEELGLTQFNTFSRGGADITKILNEIDKALLKTEKDYENYQDLLNQRIEVEIEVIDIRKKLGELASLETELKAIDSGIKELGETTEEEKTKTEKFIDVSTEFWNSYKNELEKATREAALFGDKQDVLKATLDFLRQAYLDLIEQGIDPASQTMTRLRQEYDLTLTELNALIEKEKQHSNVLDDKTGVLKNINDLTEDYYNKIYELGLSEKELTETQRIRAKEEVIAMGASREATMKALEAIDEYFNKLQESSIETKEQIKMITDEILGYANEFINALGNLFSAITDKRIDELDRQMQAELEAAGLLEETERERLERELQIAIETGDKETEQELKDSIARLDIQEKYERQKAQLEYKAALNEWRLSLAQAIVSGAQSVLSALTIPPPVGFILAGIAGAIAGIQIAAVALNKPQPPAFKTGGLYLGPEESTEAVIHKNEMIINQDQMSQLWNMINGGGNAGNKPIYITLVQNLDSTEIARSTVKVLNDGKFQLNKGVLKKY